MLIPVLQRLQKVITVAIQHPGAAPLSGQPPHLLATAIVQTK